MAITVCPECGQRMMVQPFHGNAAACPECDIALVIVIAPAKTSLNEAPLVAFQIRSEGGKWSWLAAPGYADYQLGTMAMKDGVAE